MIELMRSHGIGYSKKVITAAPEEGKKQTPGKNSQVTIKYVASEVDGKVFEKLDSTTVALGKGMLIR